MANYIHHNNQTLLWNAVNKIPEFQKLSPPKKDFEFKQIIEFFYHKIKNKSILSVQELQLLNRETLMAFIPNKSQIQPQTQSPSFGKPPLYKQSIQQPQNRVFETKQELSQRQFEERQNIYKQMNSKPELPSPNIFKDKEEDTKIENMDVLIQQYQTQREMEFQQYIPPLPVSVSDLSQKPRIRILEDIDLKKENLDIINVFEEKQNETIKKNVSWDSISNQEYIIEDYWEKRINQLENRIVVLEEKIVNMEIQKEVTISLENIIQKIL